MGKGRRSFVAVTGRGVMTEFVRRPFTRLRASCAFAAFGMSASSLWSARFEGVPIRR